MRVILRFLFGFLLLGGLFAAGPIQQGQADESVPHLGAVTEAVQEMAGERLDVLAFTGGIGERGRHRDLDGRRDLMPCLLARRPGHLAHRQANQVIERRLEPVSLAVQLVGVAVPFNAYTRDVLFMGNVGGADVTWNWALWPIAGMLRFLRPIAVGAMCLSCHGDPAAIDPEVKQLLAEKGSKVAKTADPLLDLARRLEPLLRVTYQEFRDNVWAVEEQAEADVARARFAIHGEKSYPDATGTLRLGFGKVAGYAAATTLVPPFTTLHGLYDRALGFGDQGDFALAPKVREGRARAGTAQGGGPPGSGWGRRWRCPRSRRRPRNRPGLDLQYRIQVPASFLVDATVSQELKKAVEHLP